MSTPPDQGANPYGAPRAPVSDTLAGDASGIIERGRSLPAGQGLEWWRMSWRLFKVAPLAWMGIWLLFVVCVMVLSIVPLLGMIAGFLTQPIFVGGIMLAARMADRSEVVPVGHLFAAFGTHAGPLALVGLIELVVWFVLAILFGFAIAALIGTTLALGGVAARPDLLAGAWLPFVGMVAVFSVIYLPLAYATWLAAALITLHDVPAIDALRMGFVAQFRNLLPMLVFGLVGILLAIVASVPVLLGWFVLGPVMMCSIYVQYREIFAAPA